VHGTKEVLHFSEDGNLVMESPREHHQCTYDFPDAKHISLDCAPAGTPARPAVWRMSFTDDDKLLIGNATETGPTDENSFCYCEGLSKAENLTRTKNHKRPPLLRNQRRGACAHVSK